MASKLEFLFDFGSPATFLAWTQLPGLVEETGAELICKPILLGGLFKATGNSPPAMVPAKGRYLMQDLMRFAGRYQVPLNMNPNFPVNTLHIMRIATAVRMYQPEELARLMDVLFQGMWVNGQNLGDAAAIAEVLNAAGLDADQLAALSQEDAVKAELKNATTDAQQRGAFGAPTFFVNDEMFFGQDRLDFVREALQV